MQRLSYRLGLPLLLLMSLATLVPAEGFAAETESAEQQQEQPARQHQHRTALILSTVLITIEQSRRDFLIPGAINIVVAANAGGAWSPFGDITTLMVWT
ncbi:MAG: hypothetical protein ABFR65_13090, partial [Pseudomonadota bacterium]